LFDIVTFFQLMFSDHTLRVVSLGTAMVGAVSGVLGCYAYLRKQAMMGAIVAHASLFGITTAFLLGTALGGSVLAMQLVLPGAFLGGVLAMAFVSLVVHTTPLKADAAMGLAVAIFFGAGIALLRMIQSLSLVGHRGLRDFLFGQAATMTNADIRTIAVLAVVAIGISLLFWKEFKLHTFDRDFAAGIGYPMHRLDQLLLATIVLAIVIGLRTVGVILIVSLLVCPAAAARQWTKSLSGMAALSAVFGLVSGIVGATLSAMVRNLPTGPVIALTATGFVFLSLFFAPHRGVIARALRRARNRKHLRPPEATLPVGGGV